MLAPDQWSTTYDTDTNTNVLMEHLSHNAPLNKLIISKLAVSYRKAITQNLLCVFNGRLIYLNPGTISTNHICRIIVSLTLRCVAFNLMHASPVVGHMREYKTLYLLKLRFF